MTVDEFLEVAFALQDQCESSDDSYRDKALKISALSKVCAEVVRYGKIPEELHIKGGAGTPVKTELVEKLFKNLNIRIGTIIRGTKSGVSYATFTLAE